MKRTCELKHAQAVLKRTESVRVFDETSYPNIGRALGISTQAAHQAWIRALNKLEPLEKIWSHDPEAGAEVMLNILKDPNWRRGET